LIQEEVSLLEQIYKYISGPIIGAFLAYWFGIRGKKIDVDLQKNKELNIVLSNMLNTWQYLNKIDEILKLSQDKTDSLVFPKEYLPYLVLKSGTLNDKCFDDLEKSIDNLKEYDPISYFELEGIGNKFDFIRTNYIVPFIKSSKNKNQSFEKINRTFLDTLLNKIEEKLRRTSKQISKKTYEETCLLIEENLLLSSKQIIDEYNFEYYELILTLIDDEIPKPTFEEFKEEFGKDDVKKQMDKELQIIMENGLEKVIEIMLDNDFSTIEELEHKINQR
jgi:hypothetical protein